jgi:hypothetical protein
MMLMVNDPVAYFLQCVYVTGNVSNWALFIMPGQFNKCPKGYDKMMNYIENITLPGHYE